MVTASSRQKSSIAASFSPRTPTARARGTRRGRPPPSRSRPVSGGACDAGRSPWVHVRQVRVLSPPPGEWIVCAPMSARSRIVGLALIVVSVVAVSCSDDGDSGGQGESCADRCGDIATAVESGDFEGDGEQLYTTHCAVCHGGQGQGGTGPELAGVVA